MNQFHLISVFVAVVDTEGFAAAARKLNLSPPAVTRAINDLERQLGVRLLTRTTRVVRVTEAGERYVQDCRRIMAELIEANESVAGSHAEPRGQLTITASALFGARYVMPVVTEYLQRYSQVSVACLFLDRVVNMMDEGVDIAVRIGELPDSSMQAMRVGDVRRIVCAAPAYLEKRGAPNTPDELITHDIVSANAVTRRPEWRFEKAGVAHNVKLQPRIVTSTNDSAIAAVLNGFGITRLLSYQVADYLADGRLVVLLDEFEAAALPVHVVHREGRYATPKVRALLDRLVAQLRANQALNFART
jgi:DNA-binding transcriptional LysR family regulator